MIEPGGLDQFIQLQSIKPQASAPDLGAATMFRLQVGSMYPSVVGFFEHPQHLQEPVKCLGFYHLGSRVVRFGVWGL